MATVMRAMTASIGVGTGGSNPQSGITSSGSYTNLLGLGNAFVPGSSGAKTGDSVNNNTSGSNTGLSSFVFPSMGGEDSRGGQSPGLQALGQESPPGILIK